MNDPVFSFSPKALSYSPFAIRHSLLRLFIAGKHIIRSLPRAEIVKVSELLHELHRLIHDPLLLVVVTDFDVTGEREVLAQGMPLEAVIGEDAPQIWVTREQHAVEIEGLALEPVGSGKHLHDARHRRHFVGPELHA